MKAPVPSDAAKQHGWVPGQAFRARIFVQRLAEGLSVPNVAVVSGDGKTWVDVRNGEGVEKREVKLGARGPARSEVLSGLQPGDAVVLTPDRGQSETAVPAADEAEAGP